MRIKLCRNAFELGLSPREGGCVTHFSWQGHDILRPAPAARSDGTYDARDFAAFPLVPFSGRIEGGQLKTRERTVQLNANMPPEPHAIHGHGWQTEWHVQDRSDTQVTLGYDYDEGEWPWRYRALQRFTLTESGLRYEIDVTNRSESEMPAGLGWHPYFPRAGAVVDLPLKAVWPNGDSGLAQGPKPLTAETRFDKARPVSELLLDNCFDAAGTPHRLIWPDYTLTLTADPLFAKTIVFVPAATAYFCVEPVSHAPNAVNSALTARETGLKWLAPGASLGGSVALDVAPV